MKNIKYLLYSFCSIDVDSDRLIINFRKIFSGKTDSIAAYSTICRILLSNNYTLSDYLFDLIKYSENPLMEKYLQTGNELILSAVNNDIEILRTLSEITSAHIKAYLSKKHEIHDLLWDLPVYENGEFTLSDKEFLDFARKRGTGKFARYNAFVYENDKLLPILNTDGIRLEQLKKYEIQRSRVVLNTYCFLKGLPCSNVLLYGDRGTGKSSTVKALLNEFDGLRMVELKRNGLADMQDLMLLLSSIPHKFIIYIDDIAFSENDDDFNVLKSVLEGSLSVKPDNVLIYATTNRRHIIKETVISREGGEVHVADSIDDSMALSERFGVFVSFLKPGKDEYLEIVAEIAKESGLDIPKDVLFEEAERFALNRMGRSPRIARQYVDMAKANAELGIEGI